MTPPGKLAPFALLLLLIANTIADTLPSMPHATCTIRYCPIANCCQYFGFWALEDDPRVCLAGDLVTTCLNDYSSPRGE
ncbi:hypothetical protein B0T25DRAFT_548311 [Lasiosphaeria hispida]|uniref:Extracellular membrane protein CFEM domain-containing protein n=1 Tax=Lasiosphaeria hispida TaxID=260671 RepID=A0AAJ0HEQ9_9PEZI|nr:hypothetical protein B0T25DRAFT_548311 [Lasiosphaeria hispida]